MQIFKHPKKLLPVKVGTSRIEGKLGKRFGNIQFESRVSPCSVQKPARDRNSYYFQKQKLLKSFILPRWLRWTIIFSILWNAATIFAWDFALLFQNTSLDLGLSQVSLCYPCGAVQAMLVDTHTPELQSSKTHQYFCIVCSSHYINWDLDIKHLCPSLKSF